MLVVLQFMKKHISNILSLIHICDNQIDMVNREKVEDFCKTAEKEEQAAVDIVQPNRDSLQY